MKVPQWNPLSGYMRLIAVALSVNGLKGIFSSTKKGPMGENEENWFHTVFLLQLRIDHHSFSTRDVYSIPFLKNLSGNHN